MELLKDKKISFLMILFSALMLIFGMITKDSTITDYDLQGYGYKTPPLKWHNVSAFGMSFGYVNFLLFFTIILGVGIYLFIYKNDQSLKLIIKKPEFYDKIKIKYPQLKNKNLIKEDLTLNMEKTKTEEVPVIIYLGTLFAVFFTFYMGISTGFTLWFFIILSYFHLITLTPKTKKTIIFKAIGYPLIFLLLFSIALSKDVYSSRFTYMLTMNFLPFLVSVIIIYFSQIRRFKNPPKFNKKSPLFLISVICFIISLLRFGIEKFI